MEKNFPVEPKGNASVEVTKFHSYGWKIRLRKFLVFYLPLLITEGVVAYLFFSGKPAWLVFPLMFAGLFGFAFLGIREEARMLGSFNCPSCNSEIERDTNAKGGIIYPCRQCSRTWDIGYKERSYT